MLSLLAGCGTCPEDYQRCGWQCWKRIEKPVNFWTAAALCEAESTRLSGGDPNYIGIPSPTNEDENNCVKRFAPDTAVWLGYITGEFVDENRRQVYMEYKRQWFMIYKAWAAYQPDILWLGLNEFHVVYVPPNWWVGSGWHNWREGAQFHPLCVTRVCR